MLRSIEGAINLNAKTVIKGCRFLPGDFPILGVWTGPNQNPKLEKDPLQGITFFGDFRTPPKGENSIGEKLQTDLTQLQNPFAKSRAERRKEVLPVRLQADRRHRTATRARSAAGSRAMPGRCPPRRMAARSWSSEGLYLPGGKDGVSSFVFYFFDKG